MLCSLGLETQCFELAGHAAAVERSDGRSLASVAVTTTGRTDRLFAFCFFGEVRELVGAEHEFLALCSVGMTLVVRTVDHFLHLAGECLCKETAVLLDVEEQFPCLLGDGIGEVFDVVRTATHIDEFVEVSLLLQQQLLVAGKAFAEVVGSLVGLVERSDHDAIDIADGSRHGFGLRAEQVDITVEERLVVFACDGADVHLAGAVALGLVLLHNLSPKQTSCTELGDFHEVVFAHTHVELDALRCLSGIDTSLGQLLQVFVTPGQCVAEFLIDVGTAVVERYAVDVDAAELRQFLQCLDEGLSLGQHSRRVLTLEENLLHRVEVDAALQFLQVVALLLEIGNQNLSQFDTVALARLEVQFDAFGNNAFEQRLDRLFADHACGKAEAERIDALVEDVQRLGIGSLRIVAHDDVLAHVPQVVVGFVTTDERKFARKGVHRLQVLEVLTAVERLYVEAFVGSPDQPLLKVSAFQVHLDFVEPFLSGRCLKFRKQFFSVSHYKNYYLSK